MSTEKLASQSTDWPDERLVISVRFTQYQWKLIYSAVSIALSEYAHPDYAESLHAIQDKLKPLIRGPLLEKIMQQCPRRF